MIIDYKKVLNTNTDFYKNYYTFDNTHHFAQITGQHYKLLTYVSHLFDGKTILDVGTYDGGSCLALAQNKKNTIITYDVVNEYYKEIDSATTSFEAKFKSGYYHVGYYA